MNMDEEENSSPGERIRAATKTEHVELEDRLMETYFDGGQEISRAGYIKLLESFYGLFKPLEQHLVKTIDSHLPSYDYNRKLEYLEEDLRQLGHDDADIQAISTISLDTLATIDNTAELLGVLYVIEGSELGASTVLNLLQEHLSDETLEATAYYGRSTEEARRRWGTFQECMQEELDKNVSVLQAINRAKQTFQIFRKWMT